MIAALIAVFGAVPAYLLGQRRMVVERKRISCAEAIADALQWLELPYRIRRRPDDGAETIASLGERTNHLRERLQFHEKWLRIEIPKSVPSYRRLVEAVMATAGPAIEEAWNSSPIKSAKDMNLGRLDISQGKVDAASEDFSSEVVKALAWWRILG